MDLPRVPRLPRRNVHALSDLDTLIRDLQRARTDFQADPADMFRDELARACKALKQALDEIEPRRVIDLGW